MPAWLLGVLAYRMLMSDRRVDRRVLVASAICPIALYGAMVGVGTPEALSQATSVLLGPGFATVLRFSDEFMWNGIIGVLFALHVYAVGMLVREAGSEQSRLGDGVRWLAGASFSIYLVHYPLLQLIGSILPEMAPPVARDLILLAATLSIALLFARAFERPLPAFRRHLLRLSGRSEFPAQSDSARQ